MFKFQIRILLLLPFAFFILASIGCSTADPCSFSYLRTALERYDGKFSIRGDHPIDVDNTVKYSHFETYILMDLSINLTKEQKEGLYCFCMKYGLKNEKLAAKTIAHMISNLRQMKVDNISRESEDDLMKQFHASLDLIVCENSQYQLMIEQFNRFSTGEHIVIYGDLFHDIDSTNVSILVCPNINWQYEENKDLAITGIITDKSMKADSSDAEISVYVEDLSKQGVTILGQPISVKDTFVFSLRQSLKFHLVD